MTTWTGLFATGLLLVLAAQAAAQTPLILDRNRSDRVQPVAPTTQEPLKKPSPQGSPLIEGGTEESAVAISSIRFVGLKAPASAARAAEPFIGQPATRANLRQIAVAISKGYEGADVALFTVLVPEQDFAGGVVRIVLIEGQVEKIVITDTSTGRAKKLIAAIAGHMVGEKPLRRSTLQRYVSLMQDVPGTKTDIDIVQGSQRGLVRVVLTVTDRKNDIGFGFNNRTGTTYRGGEFTASGHFYNLLRGGDQTDVTAAASTNFKGYRYASISHSTPVGSDGGRLTGSFGYLETHPRNSPIKGKAELAGLTYSWSLIRSYKRNLTLSGSVDGLNSDNAAFGQLIASERTRALRAAAGYVEALPRRTLSVGITVSRGIDMLGARVTVPFAEARFTKVNARAGVDQAIGKRTVARLKVSGQYSKDRLPAAERFAVGGEEFGRAFEVALLSADRGVAGSAEIAIKPMMKSKMFGATEFYAFVDGAKLTILDRGPFPGGRFDLASAGGGARLAYASKAALFLEAAKPIDRPYPGYEKDWRISVGWKLSLKP